MAGLSDAPVILMYHRVADIEFDPWGLAVSPLNFQDQVQSLIAGRTILSMDELVAALNAGVCPPSATAITFDDGYSDNALNAVPVLEARALPATIFVTVDGTRLGRTFWWDDLSDIISRAPDARISIELNGVPIKAEWSKNTASKRQAYMRVWKQIQELSPELRRLALTELRKCPEQPGDVSESSRPLSARSLHEIASDRIQIGGHGCDHAPLTSLPAEMREIQISQSRDEVAEWTGHPVSGFAYPHGDWDELTRQFVRDNGYGWAVTTRHGLVDPRKFDRFALPRIKVNNWTGPELLRHINNSPVA